MSHFLFSLICFCIGLSIGIYYSATITGLIDKDYDLKREFLLDLIPFRRWIKLIIDKYNQLD